MAIPKCKICLAPRNLLHISNLHEKRNEKKTADFVREVLDMAGFSAILAVGCEEC